MVNINKLADNLKSEDFRVTKVEPMSDITDGMIYIGELWHVQVGEGYFVIMQEFEEKFIIRGEATTVPQLITMLRKFKSEMR